MLALLPGWLAAGIVAPAASRNERLLLALTTSPFLSGALGSIAMLAGAGAGLAGRLVVLLCAACAIGPVLRPRPGGASDPGPGSKDAIEPLILAGAWTALIGALLVGNPVLQIRTDGWFHAAVTEQIARRGLPPEDPFFAGLRLLYFWGAHAWSALWIGMAPGIRAFTPLVVMNLAGAFAVVLGIWSLAQRLGASRSAARWSLYLGLLGYAPFAWGWMALRASRGTVTGWPEIQRIVHSGAGPALQAMSPGLLHLSMVFFPGKQLVLTSFGLGLGLFLAFLLCVAEQSDGTRARASLRLALILAAALFLHTVVGITCLLLLGGWGLFDGLRRARARESLLPVVRAGAAALGALVVLAPYLASIMLGKESQLRAGLSPLALSTWLWGGLLFVPAGMIFLLRRSRGLFAMAALLTLLGLTLDPSDNNQSKFLNLLFLMLAAPAAILLRSRLRGWRGGIVLAATLPTVMVSLWAYATDRGQTLESWAVPTPELRDAYAWAREHVAADAIFVEPRAGRGAPVFAARSVLWGGNEWAKKWGYSRENLESRRKASEDILSGGLSEETRGFLARLNREVIAVRNSPETLGNSRSPAYSNPSVVLERAFSAPPRASGKRP
jgi:hypothetical protein